MKKKILAIIIIISTISISGALFLFSPYLNDLIEDETIDGDFRDISIQSSITHVQPMTGIVFWTDSDDNDADEIQLEYSYMLYSDIVSSEDTYDWTVVDDLLEDVESRGHQAILRFRYVYPGYDTAVPSYIKALGDYHETMNESEGEDTWFPDWSHTELQQFTLDFYTNFANLYDDDPRLAFLQVGFGLWAEYHIYDPGVELGVNFPSKEYQRIFLNHMNNTFNDLHWSVSIDAYDNEVSPFAANPDLLNLNFGLFDDSFLWEDHESENAGWFAFFDYQERYQHSPIGGELSYMDEISPDVYYDQIHALDENGPYGISFEEMAAQYHISYMIGNDQPEYQSMSRIEEAGMAIGYKFQITEFKASTTQSKVMVKNIGIAPIYYDAYVSVDGTRSIKSLKGLLPGQSSEFLVNTGGANPTLNIECDRLVEGQEIEFEAGL